MRTRTPTEPPATSIAQVTERRQCWIASCLLHGGLLAALSCILLPSPAVRPRPAVHTEWTSTPSVERLDSTTPLVTESTTPSGGSRSPFVARSASPVSMPRVTFNSRVPSLTGPLIENLSLHEAVRLGPLAPAGGNGSGDGSGDGAGSGFFPVDKPGGRYVFIVDASKSMNHPYPGPARTRFGRAKYELWQTILRMQPEQRFFILFFNTQPAPMPSAVMRPGGRDGNEDLFRWTADFPATGGTDPQAAVLLALQLQPDVIYLLTDGQFNFRVVHESAKVNTRRVRIDTISLGDDIGSRVLQDLAARNGGTYRHVDEQADRYWDDLPATAPLRNASVPE